MGAADREYEYRNSRRRGRFSLGQPGNALVALVTLNIIFFLLILTVNLFSLYVSQGKGPDGHSFSALQLFVLPASLTEFIKTPWTILTFMFSHGGGDIFPMLLNMLSSMLWIWMFGFILQDLSGNNFIFPVYIYGSLAGAVLFIAAAHFIPALQNHMELYFLGGSTCGTIALAVAVTSINHDYRIFRHLGRGIPVWVLTVAYLFITLLDLVGSYSPYPFSFIAAALAGYVFVYYLKRGKDGSIWMSNVYDKVNNLFTPGKKATSFSVKEKIFYNRGHREPYKKTAIITQKRVDEILDKINQRGYDYLTEEEKTILKKAAEEDNF